MVRFNLATYTRLKHTSYSAGVSRRNVKPEEVARAFIGPIESPGSSEGGREAGRQGGTGGKDVSRAPRATYIVIHSNVLAIRIYLPLP